MTEQTHEYTFYVELKATARVRATSEEHARVLLESIDVEKADGGAGVALSNIELILDSAENTELTTVNDEEPAPFNWTRTGGPTDALSLDEESEANADASYAVDMEA